MLRKSLSILLVFLVAFSTLSANNSDLTPSYQLSISDGLPHTGVTSILEDSKGYLWFGTFDGLSCYDGYEFTTYRNKIDDRVLVSNRVRSLTEDANGNIWVGTDEGISLYDYEKQRFTVLYDRPSYTGPIVLKTIIDKERKQVYCITERDGILVFDDAYNFKSKHALPKVLSSGNVTFMGGAQLTQNRLVIASPTGIYTYDITKGNFHHVLKESVPSGADIAIVDDAHFVVCTHNGLPVVEYRTEQEKLRFRVVKRHLKGEPLRCASVDMNSKLWVGSFRKGVICIDDISQLSSNEPLEKSRFSYDNKLIRSSCVTPTASYGCWFGTFNRGVYHFDNKKNAFKHYSVDMDDPYGLKSNEVLHMTNYSAHQLFICSHTGGVALFNNKTESFDPLPFHLPGDELLRSSAVMKDRRGNVWMRLSGNRGVGFVSKGSRRFQSVSSVKYPEFTNLSVKAFVDGNFNQLWVGGEEGLYRLQLDKNNKVVRHESLLDHPMFKGESPLRIRCLYTDPHHDYLWVGTKEHGLFRITESRLKDVKDLEVKRYVDADGKNLLPSSFVASVVRLPNDELWIGLERGGIGKLLESDDETTFVGFSEKDGLSNNVVKSIQYDSDYNLWISTNVGLNKFDTKDNTFRVFTKEDGLPFIDFTNVGVMLKNGTLFFSGLDGFCYFNPKDVIDTEPLPRLEFSAFKLYNREVFPGDTVGRRVLLDRRLNEVKHIDLKYDENVFSIETTSLHYSTPSNHFLRYQLLPLSEEWITVASDQREMHYNGLPPGEYQLRVMASNSLGKWTAPKELSIKVKSPYWRTTLAYIIYVLLLGGVVYVVIFFVLKIQRLHYNLEIEHLEKEKGKEVNSAKLRFFSNISHEIKTPITLISGPVNVLAERFKHHPDVSEKLNIVKRQSRKISQLVDQVHDFQRADANQLKMNYSTFSFDTFVKELQEDFSFLAENEGKNLLVDKQTEPIYVKADEDKLSKIFNNLLSNAFKFTDKDDAIMIDYYVDQDNLIVKVKDSGKGIDSNDLPHVFERFFQSQKMKKEYTGGSGIGLAFSKRLVEMHYGFVSAESTEGEGTTMTVKLPILTEELPDVQTLTEEDVLSAEESFVATKVVKDNSQIENIKIDAELANTTIYLVEDNTEMRMFVKEVLSNFFKVKVFVNGKECLTAMEEEWPDLVVSDVLMPEMNGFELTRAIKSDIKTSHIPVILLTACTVIDDQIKGIREGADAYIMKPFDIGHLVARIEYLLQAREKLRARFEANLPLQLKKDDDGTKDIVFLEKLYQLMSDNLGSQELDLNQFARELYLNRTHFYQKVKALTNQTPFELLKNYRLKKAGELLLNEKLPVNEVIDATGFKSRSHFIKSFKEMYNTTPGKYAQGVKEEMDNK